MIQQLQLLGGRVHLFPVHDQLIAVEIDNELVEHQLFLGIVGDLAAAQHSVDMGHQLLHLKGLDDIVVRAHFQARDAVVHLAFGGEHDDGHLAGLAYLAADSPAVHHREHDVQQHQVRRLLFKLLNGLAAVISAANLKALLFHVHPDQIGYVAVVLNHQNIACHGGSSFVSAGGGLFFYYTGKAPAFLNIL